MAKKLKFKKKVVKEGDSKKANKKEFPKISRFIPDKSNEIHVFIILLLFILVSAVIVSFDLYRNLVIEKKLVGETTQLQNRLSFWENEARMHPDFRDAYFNLALIEYQLRDYVAARENLEKTLSIDPNFEKGRKLEEILYRGL